MIEVRELRFAYGKREVLRNVSLTAESGQCVAILGNNGSGKSTLITCIDRIRIPSSGQILLDGRDISAMSRTELARKVAYMPQKTEISRMTVFDCLLMGRKPYIQWTARQEDLDICEQMLQKVGMGAERLRYVDELSGGEMQKVILARALVQQPDLLLLDEPTSSLDPRNQYEMMELVHSVVHDSALTALVVLHDLNVALRYCDRFFLMKEGTGYCCGDASVMTGENIAAVYGIRAEVAQVGGRRTVIIG